MLIIQVNKVALKAIVQSDTLIADMCSVYLRINVYTSEGILKLTRSNFHNWYVSVCIDG